MNLREQKAFARDIRRGIAGEQQRTYKQRLAEIDADAARQRDECAQEHRQIKERLGERVYLERIEAQRLAQEAARLKREAAEARKRAKVSADDARAQSAQKARACKTEHAAILEHKAGEKQHRGEIVTLERQATARQKAVAPKKKRGETAAEKRGQVEHDLPPELVPLWRKVGHRFKAKPGASLAEAFIEAHEEDPDLALEVREEAAEEYVRQLQREEAEQGRALAATARGGRRGPRKTTGPKIGASDWGKRFQAIAEVPF